MADLISVPNSYLATLMHRASLHSPTNLIGDDAMIVSKAEHAELQKSQREYLSLRQALIRGGLSLETLEVLLHGHPDQSDGYEYEEAWNPSASADDSTEVAGGNRKRLGGNPKQAAITLSGAKSEDSPGSWRSATASGLKSKPYFAHKPPGSFLTPRDGDDKLRDGPTTAPASGPTPSGTDQRTILISNLSNEVTHLNLTKMIRGGRLVDIHLRHDGTAAVTFAEGAAEFLAYAKRQDLYLHGKRLEFRWSERQYFVLKHVAIKIADGATRNLVIRRGGAKSRSMQPESLTKQGIRDDLEHIHTMHVVSVTFMNGDCYVSTNSVQNAMFARTCMMSRSKYKGLRIDWYPDECAQPLPRVEKQRHSLPSKAHDHPAVDKRPPHSLFENRFQVLDTTAADATSDAELERLPVTTPFAWADKGVVV